MELPKLNFIYFILNINKGKAQMTTGKLKKKQLVTNSNGKIVSKKQSEDKRKRFGKKFSKWGSAVIKARNQLNIKGFCPIGGRTPAGQRLLAKVRSLV